MQDTPHDKELSDARTPAIDCYRAATQAIGFDGPIHDMEPEVLSLALRRRGASDLTIDKVHAVGLVLRQPGLFLEDPHVHENVVLLMNDRAVAPLIEQDCDVEEICWAITALLPLLDAQITAHEDIDELVEGAWSDAVLQYWAEQCHEQGMTDPPHLLRACRPHLHALLLPQYRGSAEGDDDVSTHQRQMLKLCEDYVAARLDRSI